MKPAFQLGRLKTQRDGKDRATTTTTTKTATQQDQFARDGRLGLVYSRPFPVAVKKKSRARAKSHMN